MRFTTRKRRQPPAIIIVSLIDILIVLLIFLMVTTSFKQQPAIKITLPVSNQAVRDTAQPGLVVTVNKQEPFFHWNTLPVTLEKLKERLRQEARTNPSLPVTIRADEASTIGNAIKVWDAVRAAGLPDAKIVTREAASR